MSEYLKGQREVDARVGWMSASSVDLIVAFEDIKMGHFVIDTDLTLMHTHVGAVNSRCRRNLFQPELSNLRSSPPHVLFKVSVDANYSPTCQAGYGVGKLSFLFDYKSEIQNYGH